MTTSILTVATPALASDDVRFARAFLMRLAEPGTSPTLWQFVADHGPAEAMRRLSNAEAPTALVPGGPRLESAGEAAEKDLHLADQLAARLVVPEDAEWPTGLINTFWSEDLDATPPLGLWVRGDGNLASIAHFGVALVGSRASTTYGDH